ncbi:hypothetical protein K491DRAFT_244270 [Lophiostoma macrostomum CBS 122681]|uniref:Uncharacterized protein n=1 Tax=Lophiostoma macrostomum CBS 122681 TaxID=1314788 RepID=A0A6A6TH13_9PLEO|nr:hypothetical protein K491DRAFT_244270 [Lophiostoma macrostomum CBS 122681]
MELNRLCTVVRRVGKSFAHASLHLAAATTTSLPGALARCCFILTCRQRLNRVAAPGFPIMFSRRQNLPTPSLRVHDSIPGAVQHQPEPTPRCPAGSASQRRNVLCPCHLHRLCLIPILDLLGSRVALCFAPLDQ